MRTLKLAAALLLAATPLSAQLSGSYLIDPSNPSAYQSIDQAARDLYVQGVSGAVEFFVVPGTYNMTGVWLLPVPGASATNTITFRSITRDAAKLTGVSGPTLTLIGANGNQCRHYIITGFEFTGASDFAIQSTDYVQDIEIFDNTFLGGHRQLFDIRGNRNCNSWKVHHNDFTCGQGQSYGFYLSQIGQWEFHHNSVDLNGVLRGMYFINLNDARNRLWSNVFVGSLRSSTSAAAIYMAASNYNNEVSHNSFFVTTQGSGTAIYTSGIGSRQNKLFSNTIVVSGPGSCITMSSTNFQSDYNVMLAPTGNIGADRNGTYPTLSAWQAASGQDNNSIVADPLYTSTTNLRPMPGSPVQGFAANSPSYATTDITDRYRDSQPDAGAYELNGFALFGRGCAGAGGMTPAMGSNGTVAIGSNNLQITLQNALGGASLVFAGGFSDDTWGGNSLPFDLGGSCFVYSSMNASISLTAVGSGAGNGTALVPIPIPANPALIGKTVFFQWLVLDPAANNSYGLASSDAGSVNL